MPIPGYGRTTKGHKTQKLISDQLRYVFPIFYFVLLCLFVANLTDAVGVALPDDDDLAFECVCDGFERGFVGHEAAILF
jgi:hypothetical protein